MSVAPSSITCAIGRASRRGFARSSHTRTRKSRPSSGVNRGQPLGAQKGSFPAALFVCVGFLANSAQFAQIGLLLAYLPLLKKVISPKIPAQGGAVPAVRPRDESNALRSAGHTAGRLGRGGPGRAAPLDPQILREDPRWPRQCRRGATLHQSCQ